MIEEVDKSASGCNNIRFERSLLSCLVRSVSEEDRNMPPVAELPEDLRCDTRLVARGGEGGEGSLLRA